jgi:death-on-curing protein
VNAPQQVRYFTPDEARVPDNESVAFDSEHAGLFASAVERPRQSAFGEDAYKTIFEKAAAMLDSLVNNHALHSGNKRTAWRLTKLFLALNGQWLMVDFHPAIDFCLRVAGHHGERPELDEIAAFLEAHCVPDFISE